MKLFLFKFKYCVVFIFALSTVSSVYAAEFEFKLQHFLSAKAPTHTKMILPWTKAVEKLSGGRIKIDVYPSMTLGGKSSELISQARDGVVDLIWTANGYTPGLFPRSEVFELPNVYKNNPVATNLALYELFDKELKQEYGGLEVMFLHVHGGFGIVTVDTQVKKTADLSGKKIRTPSRVGAWVIEALNAHPVAMPVPDLPAAFQKGVVDGALIPWEIIPVFNFQEQAKYQSEGKDKERFGTIVFQLSMNKKRWDSLPADIQQAFIDASDEKWLTHIGNVWRNAEDHGIQVAIDAGNKHTVLDAKQTEEFTIALEPVVQRWIKDVSKKGINGADLVKTARLAIKKHSHK